MDHKAIIQRNFTYLKEDVYVKSCLDHMWGACALTREEYELCKTDHGQFLFVLMRKGSSGYRAFVAALDQTGQSHVKQRLDETCEETGRIDLLYVNKKENEKHHQDRIAKLERRISELENDNKQKAEDITHVSHEKQAAIRELNLTHEREITELDQRMKQTVNQLELEIQSVLTEKSNIQRHLQDTEDQRTKLDKELSALKKAFDDLSERYEAITPTLQEETTVKSDRLKYSTESSKDETCGKCHKTFSEDDTAFLLPCLHKICIECMDNAQDPSKDQCSVCLTPFLSEDLKTDPARSSKVFLKSLKSSRSCGYNISHDKEPPVCYCQECGYTLCEKCKIQHSQTRACLHHQTYSFESLDQIPPQKLLLKVFCPVHPETVLNLYDTTCGKNICVICAQDEHKDHATTDLDKAYASATAQLEEPLQDLQNKSMEIQRGIQEAHDLQDDIDTTAAALMENVAKTRESLSELLLGRQKELRDDINKCSEASKLAVAETLNRLYQMNESVKTTTGFIKMIKDFCSKADFMDLKNLAEEKAQRDVMMQTPRVDRRSLQMKVSMVGLRALQDLIGTFMSLYSIQEESDDVIPDDVQTTTEFKGEIRKLEDSIRTLTIDLDRTTKKKELDEGKWLISERNYKAQILSQTEEGLRLKQEYLSRMKVQEQSFQTEREKNIHLGKRCHDLEKGMSEKIEKIKALAKDLEKTKQEASEENKLIHDKYKQLEQSFEQRIICVSRHRGDPNCMIECSKITFAVDRLDARVGSIIDGVFTNQRSVSLDPRRNVFRKYNGTVSSSPIYPAPCRPHQYPAYWEIAVDVEILRELLHSDIILEIGMVSENILDEHTLVYRANNAWCMVLRFCGKHKGICLQVWKNGERVTCSSDAIPNRKGESNTFKYGGLFDVENGKLTFLELTKDLKLASFQVENDGPLFLTFGFPPRSEHVGIHFRLVPPADLSMPAEKKNLILSVIR